jgi:hypothetical protein
MTEEFSTLSCLLRKIEALRSVRTDGYIGTLDIII